MVLRSPDRRLGDEVELVEREHGSFAPVPDRQEVAVSGESRVAAVFEPWRPPDRSGIRSRAATQQTVWERDRSPRTARAASRDPCPRPYTAIASDRGCNRAC